MVLKDSDIRPHLLNFIKEEHPNAFIKPEFNISDGFVRSDIGVISDELHGYEIKSDVDTLRRLITQEICYSNVFSTATLVTTKKHLEKSLEIIPKWWRVLLIDENFSFKVHRDSEPNYNNCTIALVQLLKEKEAKDILRLSELKEFAYADRNQILRGILNVYSESEIKFLTCLKLKARYKAFKNKSYY